MERRKKGVVRGALCTILVLLFVLAAIPARAATKKVTSLGQLQAAINEAGRGDVIEIGKTIWVKSTISVRYDREFTLKGGTLKRSAGFTGEMMCFEGKPLSGDYVVSQDPSQAKVTFENVIFDGNKKNVPDSDEIIYFYNGATVNIKNCTFKNNGDCALRSGSSWGYGIAFVPTTITGSKFVNNNGTAISYYGATEGSDGELAISDTVISGNAGSGIRSNNGFILKNVEIKNNSGDGIYCGCGGEDFIIIGGKISGNGEYGIDARSCDILLKGGVKITGNKQSGIYDGNSSIDRDSVVTLGDVQISGNKEYGIYAYNKIVLRGATEIADPVLLKYSDNGRDWGQILVESKLKTKGRVAEIITQGINTGSECIYIGSNSFGKLSQFKCASSEKRFVMGSNHWATLQYGQDESMPGTPALTAKKGKTNAAILSWKAAGDADGYQIQVSINGAKYKTLAKLAGSAKKHTARGLKKGATYSYKIRAFRNISGKTIYGAYSDIQKVKI